MYGDEYLGNLSTTKSYESLTTDAMRDWYTSHLVPQHATILVGGDITIEEIQPLLEERLGSWAVEEPAEFPVLSTDSLAQPEETIVYLVDKPGAAQSVIRMGAFVGSRTDADHTNFKLANMVMGGYFIARINMNLREDKGWTYGARSWTSHNRLPGLWTAASSVRTDVTADSLSEIFKEIRGPAGDAPITLEELQAAQGSLLGEWPLNFENPGYLLSQTVNVRRYGLSDDWLSGHADRLREVDLASAQLAWDEHINPDKIVVLIVGDAAQVREPLAALGMPIVDIDADGNPIQ